MKKVIAIFGSPRKEGNSDILLNEFIRGITKSDIKIESVVVRDLQIAPCNSCGGCWESGTCVINDDMQKIYPLLVEADGIVISSPIYFMGVPAQLKALIDRCQSFWAKKYILNLPIREGAKISNGFFIATAARDKGMDLFSGAVKTVKAFFHVLDTKYIGDMLCHGLEGKTDAADKQALLKQAYSEGKSFDI